MSQQSHANTPNILIILPPTNKSILPPVGARGCSFLFILFRWAKSALLNHPLWLSSPSTISFYWCCGVREQSIQSMWWIGPFVRWARWYKGSGWHRLLPISTGAPPRGWSARKTSIWSTYPCHGRKGHNARINPCLLDAFITDNCSVNALCVEYCWQLWSFCWLFRSINAWIGGLRVIMGKILNNLLLCTAYNESFNTCYWIMMAVIWFSWFCYVLTTI